MKLKGCELSALTLASAYLLKQDPVKGHGTRPTDAAADKIAGASSSGCWFMSLQLSNSVAAWACNRTLTSFHCQELTDYG